MEPTPQEVSAVAATPQAQPQAPAAPQPQQQPAAPTPQAAPSQAPADPFASLFASEPAAPAAPATPAAPQPQQPTEPSPTPQPSSPPTEPTQPTATQPTATQPTAPAQPATLPPPPVDDYQTFEEYMNETLKGLPAEPAQPDPEKINPEDPAAIKKFFDELMNTAVARATTQIQKQNVIQSAEKRAWDSAFDKYGSLKTNKNLRDMVHNIRMGYFQRGIAITPTQAADKLLESLGTEYKKGVADNQVQTTIEQVQPQGGGGTPVPTTLDKQSLLTAVQSGGEQALAAALDSEIKAGRM